MAASLFTTACSSTRAGYQTAPYVLVRSEGAFELRDYPPLRVVETRMDEAAGEGGFGKLFRYISGENEQSRKISMTTPVFMTDESEGRKMAFVLPEASGLERPPAPAEPAVTLREVSGGRFAVLRFSGGRNEGNEQDALKRLRAWLVEQGQRPVGVPVFAYFDPPWTPPFLRRNEVMLRVGVEPVQTERPGA